MTSAQDLPSPEKPSARAEGAKPQAGEKLPPKRSMLPIVLIVVCVVVLAPTVGLGIWFGMGKPAPVVVDPGKPIPPEPPAPPPAFTTTLAITESAAAPTSESALAKTTGTIAGIANSLPQELLLASVDGTAPSRLIVSGSLERSADAISRIPRHERWEIRIGAGNTSDSYTRQLDYFKIE